MGRLAEVTGQAKRFWGGLTPGRRAAFVVLGIAAGGGAVAAYVLAGRLDLAPLYANMSEDDAAAAARKLRERKIPHEVEGRTLLVPRERVDELRLELAAEGIPRGGGVGFELFDKRTLGLSEFAQRLNYRRALMGELARTISSLEAVERARVHLVIPERRVFSERQQEASASVVLRMRAGRSLAGGQIQGIVHLVASAVEGLRPENVTLVDEEGRLLWRPRKGDPQDALEEMRLDRERALEQRVTELVERMVGAGKAVVRVAAEIDLDRQETTVEDYDPEVRVVRSEQEMRETLGEGSVGATGGVPGTRANLPTAQPSPPATPKGASRESNVRNYEVKRTVQKTVSPGGKVRRLSVAVVVDGRYETRDGKLTFVPRDEADLRKIEELVKSAVGFRAERGDVVAVRSAPFEQAPAIAGSEAASAAAGSWIPYAKYGALGFVALLLVLFFVRPVMRAILSTRQESTRQEAPSEPAPPRAEPPAALAAPRAETVEVPVNVREEALGYVRGDPRRAAQILRGWIQEKRA